MLNTDADVMRVRLLGRPSPALARRLQALGPAGQERVEVAVTIVGAASQPVDAVIVELDGRPQGDLRQWLADCREPLLAVVANDALGLEALRCGAEEYAVSDRPDDLLRALRRAVARRAPRTPRHREPPSDELLSAASPPERRPAPDRRRVDRRRGDERTSRFREVFARIERLLLSFEETDTFLPILAGQLLAEGQLPVDLLVLSKRKGKLLRAELFVQRPSHHRRAPSSVREALSAPLDDPDSIVAEVARSGRPLYLADIHRDPRWQPIDPLLEVRSALWAPLGLHGEPWGVLSFLSARSDAFDADTRALLEQVSRTIETALERATYLAEMKATREATLRALGLALERRDIETKGHTDRVVALSQRFGRKLGLSPEQLQALRWGAYLHDIGKIAMPDELLFKPGPLTDLEFAVIRRHAVVGHEIIEGMPFLPDETRQLVRHHHERWDGRGYPDGLAGEAIPLLARLFSLVDCFDALISRRPYKPAWPRLRALDELRAEAGRAFDPRLTVVLLELLEADERNQPTG